MTSTARSAPATFDEAADRFSKFLKNKGYSNQVVWAGRGDILWGRQRLWVREYSDARTRDAASKRYSKGIARELGVGLEAVASTEDATVAWVLLPKDEDEMQRFLMSPGDLKLSAMVNVWPARQVPNPLRWVALSWWFAKSTKAFLDSLEMFEEV